MPKRLVCVILAFIALTSFGLALAADSAPALDPEKKIIAKGEGVIFQNDVATAKEKALEQAKRLAVEQGVGVFIDSQTLVQNFQTVDDRILAQSAGFIKSYTILSEKTEGEVVSVEIEAIVKTAKLKGALDEVKFVVAKKEFPRLMLLIAEQNVGQEGYSYWWGTTTSMVSMTIVENTLVNELAPLGLTFVDPAVLAGKIQQKDAYQVSSAGLSNQAAREIANLSDAQVVVVGTAVATNNGPVMEGLKITSAQADASVRLVNTDNGEILLSATAAGTAQNVDKKRAGNQALEAAAKSLAKQIVEKLSAKWMTGRSIVTLDVEGLQNYRMLETLKNVLSHQIAGLTGVNERRMLKDKAQLDLFYEGKTTALAKELSLKSFPEFGLRVDEVTPNHLRITLVPAPKK